MTAAEKGRAILDSIRAIRANRDEQEKLLRQLEAQALVMLQIDRPELIASYGYDPLQDRRRRKFHELAGDLPRVWNYVVLKDGSRAYLSSPVPCP